MNFRKCLLVGIASAFAAFGCCAALAQSCTPISAVPHTITTPGRHCLTQSLQYEGTDYAVVVAASDVILDFNGFAVTGGAATLASNMSRGVLVGGRENVTVRNGAIRNFNIGVQFSPNSSVPTAAKGSVIEHMVIDGVRSQGMMIFARNVTVRDNRIVGANQTVANSTAQGILLFGAGARIVNNTIANITSAYLPYGIYVAGPGGMLIQDNFIAELGVSSNGVNGVGIYVQPNVSGGLIEGNRLIQSAIVSGTGISFSSDVSNVLVEGNVIHGYRNGLNLASSPSNKYKNNTVISATSAYNGGVNLGGNN